MSTYFKNLLVPLSYIWIFFVFSAWLLHHMDWFRSLFLFPVGFTVFINAILPLVFTLLVVVVFFFYHILRTKRFSFVASYSWATAYLGVLLYTMVIFNVTAYIRILYPMDIPALDSSYFLAHNIHIATKLLLTTLWMGLFTLIAYFCGGYVTRRFRLQYLVNNTLLRALTRIGLGFFMIMLFAFSLGLFGALYAPLFILFSIMLLLHNYGEFKGIVIALFRKHTLRARFSSLSFWIGIFLIFIIAITLLDNLHISPRGFDSLTYYVNHVHLMAQQHHLIPRTPAFPFELLLSIGALFRNDSLFVFSTALVFFAISFVAVYGIVQHLTKKRRPAYFLATLWAVTPITMYFTLYETKVDILLFFLATLSLWFFVLWIEKKTFPTILLSLFFASFMLTTKLTALFFIVPLFFSILLFMPYKHMFSRPRRRRVISYVIGMVALPLLPWILYDLYTTPWSHITQALTDDIHIQKVTHDLYIRNGIDDTDCEATRLTEDFNRYTNNSILQIHPFHIMTLPWEITMNSNPYVKKNMMEIGFVFLALVPILLVRIRQLRFTEPLYAKTAKLISFTALVYFVLWTFLAKGVVWYGYPGLLFLLILTSYLFLFPLRKGFRTFLYIIILSNIVIFTFMRVPQFAHPEILVAAATDFDKGPSRYTPLAQIVNTHTDAKIYTTATSFIYFIEKNNERVIRDDSLDAFYCFNEQNAPEKTLDFLRSMRIDYVVLSKALPYTMTPSIGNVQKKYENFQIFAKNLEKVYETPELILFTLP